MPEVARMAMHDPAPEAAPAPIPSSVELLSRFTAAGPNDPERPDGTLSDLLDELVTRSWPTGTRSMPRRAQDAAGG
jgi:hypothetical protein